MKTDEQGAVNMIRLFFVVAVFFCSSLLILEAEEQATYSIEQIEQLFPKSAKTFRIHELWPTNLAMQLPIKPMVPENFVLRELKNTDFSEYFFWGPKEALDSIDPKNVSASLQSIDSPILVFRPSFDIAQTGPQSFSGEKEIEKFYKNMGVIGFFKKTYQWGDIPVITMGGTMEGRFLFSAWIGLNYCTNVLFARLSYPPVKGRPNSNDIALWNRFLSETTGLPEPDCFIAQGIDMKDGYTVFEKYGATFTCIAERRKGDNKVQVVTISRGQDTTFSVNRVGDGLAGIAWKYGEELVKIDLRFSKKLPEGGSIEAPSFCVPIFLKTVDQFTLQTETLQRMKNVFVDELLMDPVG